MMRRFVMVLSSAALAFGVAASSPAASITKTYTGLDFWYDSGIDSFDPSLGNLTSVNLSLTSYLEVYLTQYTYDWDSGDYVPVTVNYAIDSSRKLGFSGIQISANPSSTGSFRYTTYSDFLHPDVLLTDKASSVVNVSGPDVSAFVGAGWMKPQTYGTVKWTEISEDRPDNVAGGYDILDWTFVDTLTVTYNYSPAAVPEPASWALMLVGFGAVGLAMRRRRVAFG
jgi:hypothetical protein